MITEALIFMEFFHIVLLKQVFVVMKDKSSWWLSFEKEKLRNKNNSKCANCFWVALFGTLAISGQLFNNFVSIDVPWWTQLSSVLGENKTLHDKTLSIDKTYCGIKIIRNLYQQDN